MFDWRSRTLVLWTGLPYLAHTVAGKGRHRANNGILQKLDTIQGSRGILKTLKHITPDYNNNNALYYNKARWKVAHLYQSWRYKTVGRTEVGEPKWVTIQSEGSGRQPSKQCYRKFTPQSGCALAFSSRDTGTSSKLLKKHIYSTSFNAEKTCDGFHWSHKSSLCPTRYPSA